MTHETFLNNILDWFCRCFSDKKSLDFADIEILFEGGGGGGKRYLNQELRICKKKTCHEKKILVAK